jgi:NO-binding membrane sensor protein with MHYT domain
MRKEIGISSSSLILCLKYTTIGRYILFNWKGRCENKLRLSAITKVPLSMYVAGLGHWAKDFTLMLKFQKNME